MNKMKILALLLCFSTLSASYAQEEEQQALPAQTDSNKVRNVSDQKIYQMALRYNDISVAKMKLYDLMERNPNNTRYAELLASLYFEMEQYSSSALVALDLLEKNPKHVATLEIAAYSLEQLGALERALPHFESLYLLSGDLYSLYKTSYLQYSLKKHDEALNSVNMLLKNKKSVEEKLSFPKKDNTNQEVTMLEAALNLKGLIYKEQGSESEAKTAFEEALASNPDFELAKENLASIK